VINISRALAVDLSEAAKKVKGKKNQVKVPQMNVEMKKRNYLKTPLSTSLSIRSKCLESPSNASLKIQIIFLTNTLAKTP
jgi:hypothetical protein